MKHISDQEWQLYIEGSLESEKALSIEEHLITCPLCLETFLEHIGEAEIEDAAHFVPDDFTGQIMAKVHRQGNPPVRSAIARYRKKRNFSPLVVYASAAAITLFLASQGVFSYLPSIGGQAYSAAPIMPGELGSILKYEQQALDSFSEQLGSNSERLQHKMPFKAANPKEAVQ